MRDRDIIEARDREVARHRQSQFVGHMQDRSGHLIIAGEDRRRPVRPLKQRARLYHRRLERKVCRAGQCRVGAWQPRHGVGLLKSLPPQERGHVALASGEEADAPVPQTDQVLGHLKGCKPVVHRNRGHAGNRA